jgi:hypothetical protein
VVAPAFRTESRSVQRFVGLPACEKTRLWPTVDAILTEARSDREEISDQLVFGALDRVLIADIIAGRYRDAYDALGKILGVHFPGGKAEPMANGHFPGEAALPEREVRRPTARAAGR